MKPAIPLHSPAFKWIKASDHLTPDGLDDFRARMRARRIAAQAKTTVTQLRKGQR